MECITRLIAAMKHRDGWGKDFCRKNLNPQNRSFNNRTFPDYSHTFYFEEEKFLIEYNNHKPGVR